MEVAPEIRARDEVRQPTGLRRLDLPVVLAKLGDDVRQVEEAVDLLLGLERVEVGVGPGHRLALAAEAGGAPLPPAPTPGARPPPPGGGGGGRGPEGGGGA